MSEALPFLERPASLDVSVGYVGSLADKWAVGKADTKGYDAAVTSRRFQALSVAGRAIGTDAGDVGFDPLGFSNHELGPFDTPEEHMAWMREAEIKHGRVCMLAVTGWVAVDLGARIPTSEALAPLNAYQAHDAAVADGSLILLLIICGVWEITGAGAIADSLKGKRVPGDYALTGGFCKTPKEMAEKREYEIAHCRLGMLAFGGLVTQAGLLGETASFPYTF
jgi:hypothetical protein